MAQADSGTGGAPDAERTIVVDLDWRSALVVFVATVTLIALAGVVGAAGRTLTWLVIGTLLALALNPVVDRLERALRIRRSGSVVVVLAGFLIAVIGLVLALGPETSRQVRSLGDDIPEVVAELGDIPLIGDTLVDNEVPERIEGWLDDLPATIAGQEAAIEDAARSTAGGLVATLATVLIAVTLLLDGERIVGAARRMAPVDQRPRLDRLGRRLYELVGRYFAGSVLVAILNGTFVLVVGLVLGVPLAPLIAVWVAVFNLVPQIGGAVGGIPFVLLGFAESPTVGVACAVLFIGYMNFENHILSPLIVGEAVDLSAPTTMVAALVGVAVAGVPGALVAVPLVGSAKAVYLDVRASPRAPDEKSRGAAEAHR